MAARPAGFEYICIRIHCVYKNGACMNASYRKLDNSAQLLNVPEHKNASTFSCAQYVSILHVPAHVVHT